MRLEKSRQTDYHSNEEGEGERMEGGRIGRYRDEDEIASDAVVAAAAAVVECGSFDVASP